MGTLVFTERIGSPDYKGVTKTSLPFGQYHLSI